LHQRFTGVAPEARRLSEQFRSGAIRHDPVRLANHNEWAPSVVMMISDGSLQTLAAALSQQQATQNPMSQNLHSKETDGMPMVRDLIITRAGRKKTPRNHRLRIVCISPGDNPSI
jgi:hypothetical protein